MRGLLIIASILLAFNANAIHLKNGDIILQPTSCYLCSLIESEEKTEYSHMGVLVTDGVHWNVMEAWGTVRLTSLGEFLSRRKKNSKSLVLRADHLQNQTVRSSDLLIRFISHFEGLHYDSHFLWNNSDDRGEKLYCSELVAKLLNPFLKEGIQTKPMHFEVNREFWIQYFHGTPPDGQPGLSPGDFERSPLFHKVGFL